MKKRVRIYCEFEPEVSGKARVSVFSNRDRKFAYIIVTLNNPVTPWFYSNFSKTVLGTLWQTP